MIPNLVSLFLDRQNFQTAWEKVAENNGCAGVDGESSAHFALHADAYLDQLREAVASGEYLPLPLLQFFIPKQNGGWRQLAVPTVRDRIVQQALLQVLHPLLEKHFEPSSFAYRPGRSHLMAVRQVAYWRDRDYDWVLDADIFKYFDRIQHHRLIAEIAERVNHPLVLSLVQAWLSAGILTQEGLILPTQGLPQGAVISPILANVYLDDFDEIISKTELKLVRYADDFVLMSRTKNRIIQAREDVAMLLENMGLQLHPEKTQITNFERGFRFLGQAFAGDLIVPIKKPEIPQIAPPVESSSLRLIHAEQTMQPTAMELALIEALKDKQQPIPPPLFVVLGYQVRQDQKVVIESDEIVWKEGMSTLYLVHQGTMLRKEQGRFLVQPPKEPEIEIPIREVERILVFGNVQLSTSAIAECLDAQIPVVFLSQTGQYKGHLWPAEFCDLNAEKAQFKLQDDEEFRLETARAIIWGKLLNSKLFLLKQN